ncbi:hypothetical protein NQ317_019406 [Molorchus minor]|uniref:Major facilitator superfamily (MFS) profile domain-containing protein n=1 Tax=Molorchus minor TaxID=1323400 RepID=A0ABQ9JHQ7_9CUCU|nr:hypothetical protein NQ317_019406 [Molorchus minor]
MTKNSEVCVISSDILDTTGKRQVNNKDDNPATFESAVTETGFGKYNLLLILVCLPATWAAVFETTTMSYIFAPAHCDLDLSLEDKGYLNSITYAGMITSGPVWGFLFDTLGRKKLLILGFFADACFVVISAFSQSIVPLMICKFLGGLVVNGPFSGMRSYLSEFHSSKYRPKIQLTIGTMTAIGTIVLPILAWGILTQSWEFSLFGGYLEMHSWNIYLLLCSLPGIIGGIVFLFLPESPKFLMTIGKNEMALQIFRKVYRINTGKSEDMFPIKELVDEITLNEGNKYGGNVTANRTKFQAVKEGWQQIKPLFHYPYLPKLILVCVIQMFIIQSVNTLRLWLPQIFQAVNDYQQYHNGTSTSLCVMLEDLKPRESVIDCSVNRDSSSVYINAIIVASVTSIGYTLTGTIITLVGKKKILVTLGLLAGGVGFSLYLAQDNITTTVLSSTYVALTSICSNNTYNIPGYDSWMNWSYDREYAIPCTFTSWMWRPLHFYLLFNDCSTFT